MLKRNQNPSANNASSNTYDRELVLSLAPKDDDSVVYVPVNHCQPDKNPFQWNDIYSQHHWKVPCPFIF
jgi:hypothetical protein